MTSKPARTLADMAQESSSGTGLTCPKCGCNNFATYGGSQGQEVRFRYKQCRNGNCGHRILTSTQTVERIIRDVNSHGDISSG